MTQPERLEFLIRALIEERPEYRTVILPNQAEEQKQLLRALLNTRPPMPAEESFLRVQDAYLQTELEERGIMDYHSLSPVYDKIYLWQGDITTLKVDAIVNAANSRMLGCFIPCHGCIDNAIHTYAGVQLRLACAEEIARLGREEPPGRALMTPAFNLPSSYILHTVGPIVSGPLTDRECRLLSSCYRSCLTLAIENGLRSIAFCCISTGEFHFPNDRAAEIAVQTVTEVLTQAKSEIEVIFNVFQEKDYGLYRRLLRAN